MPRTTRSTFARRSKSKSNKCRKTSENNNSTETDSDGEDIAIASKKPKVVLKKLKNGTSEPSTPISKVESDKTMQPKTPKKINKMEINLKNGNTKTRKKSEKNDSTETTSEGEEVVIPAKKPKIVLKKLKNGKSEPSTPISMIESDKAMQPTTSRKITMVEINSKNDAVEKIDGDSNSSSESDWEEVAMANDDDDREPVIPSEGVQITIDLPENKRRPKKKEFDFGTYIRRKVIRFRRDVQEAAHKVNLLCLIAHGMASRRRLMVTELRASILSLQPLEHLMIKPRKRDQKFVMNLMQWYRGHFRIELKKDRDGGEASPLLQLMQAVQNNVAESELVYVGLFIICLLNCGMDARLVMSLQPMPLKIKIKQPSNKKTQLDPKLEEVDTKLKQEAGKFNSTSTETKAVKIKPSKKKTVISRFTKTQRHQGNGGASSHKIKDGSNGDNVKRTGRRKRKSACAVNNYKVSSEDETDDINEENENGSGSSRQRTRSAAAAPSRKTKVVANGRKVSKTDDYKRSEDNTDDDDFEIAFEQIKKPGPLKGTKQNRKALSSDSDEGETGTQIRRTVGNDYWIEVYLDSVKSWICADCVRGVVNKPQDMEENASKPMSYVLAFGDDGIKDVTRRYASGWMSQCRKLRVSSEWWDETLTPFLCPPSKRDSLENEQLEEHLLEKPMPTAISEYKNHPLYVLLRHLLKFEGIYPPDSIPLGYIRGESVYSRECVHTMHSRETWMKEARVVKRGETPYKMVKARPKWNRAKGEMVTDIPLELFGKWQTEDYVSPPAENGIVPRNEYGNVELFKSCMLPKGTVHLQLTALNRIAKKLGIDCARAMTGWDFHGVGSHPVFDGWVVCEEFKEVLEDAWREEQIAADKRDREKREKRVYGNWRRLIRGLLIGERLASRYSNKASVAD